MTDERLRFLYEQAVSARGGEDRADCVSPEELVRLVERSGPEDERLRVLDHVMSCRDCGREFEMLRAVGQAQREDTGRASRDRSGWWMAMAASLVLVIGAGVVSQMLWRGGDGTLRGEDDTIELIGLTDEAAGPTLVWRTIPGALTYRLEVLDAGGELVYAAAVPDTALVLPDSVSTDPSRGYVWWIQASLADGARRSGGPVPLRFIQPPR